MRILIKQFFLMRLCCIVSLCFINPCFAQNAAPDVKRVGIVIPVEHQALREIVQGFQDTLLKFYKKPIQFKISNAQGDANLQRAIITQLRDANYDLVVSVTTTTTQMAAAIIDKQPVIGLAADVVSKQNNLVVVDDEIDKAQIVKFLHRACPRLKNIALIYSASNKLFSEVKQVEQACRCYNIKLHNLMIQSFKAWQSFIVLAKLYPQMSKRSLF